MASSALNKFGQLFGYRASEPAGKDWWIEVEQFANRAVAFVLGREIPQKQSLLKQTKEYLGEILLDGDSTLSSAISSIILALLLLLTIFMSWSNPLKNWGGRFSPFGRTNQTSTEVTDQDFSYITSEDIKQNRPHRETDKLILKHKRSAYPVHFPSYSIDDGELKIGKIRQEAAHKLSLDSSGASRVKLFYKGKNLKDDARTAREEGLRSDVEAEILVSVGDSIAVPDDESDREDEETTDARGSKKKSRKRKKKGRVSSGTATPDTSRPSSTPLPDVTYAPSRAPPPQAKTSAPKVVKTPLEQLDALVSHFHTILVPPCIQYINNPPEDKAKFEFEHKRLSESVLAQVVLKADSVETEGNDEARQRRKALVKEAQDMLNRLDEVVRR